MLGLIAGIITTLYSVFVILGFFSLNQPSKRFRGSAIRFILLMLSSISWVMALFLFGTAETYPRFLLAARLAWIPAPLLGASMYAFVSKYAQELSSKPEKTRIRIKALTAISWMLALVISFFVIFTDLVVTDVNLEIRKIIFGPMYYVALVFIVTTVGASIIKIGSVQSTILEKYKPSARLISAGIILTSLIAITTNLIIPLIVKNNSLSYLGIFATIPLTFTVSFSILRYQFLDIRVFIGRAIYYILLSAVPYVSFFALAFIYQGLFDTVFHPVVYVVSIFVGIAFVGLFNRLNDLLKTQVRTRFINPGFDPLETAERFSNAASLTLDLTKVSELTLDTVAKAIRPELATLIIFSNDKNKRILNFESNSSLSKGKEYQSIQELLTMFWVSRTPEPFVVDYIEGFADKEYENLHNLIEDIIAELAQIGVRVAVPLKTTDRVTGALLLGSKEASIPYNEQEIEFLNSIATTTSVAIERSLLYSEVQEFANTLQDKVDEATADLQEANQSLQKALRQLQEVRRRERDMIDVMGHELRTPMSIVRNALALLEREYEKSEGDVDAAKLKKYLDMGVESARREIDLIETLLSATKIDASRIQLHLVKVDHKDVIEDAIEGQKTLIGEKQLNLVYTPPTSEIFSFCDRTRVQQIMDNFLSNAAKYTQQGKVEIKLWTDQDHAWISIADTGIGIDSEDLHNLGKKFFRAKQYISNSTGDEQKIIRPGGTGLGLYVTFELVRIMGGELYINSEVNKGTKFTWSMPIFKGQEEQQIDQTFDTTDNAQRQHIYINQAAPEPK